MAGLLLTASILFHIVHATFFLDFWSIWVGPKDIPEFKAEMQREMGKEDAPGPRPGKYPLGNRLYHLAVVVAGLAVVATGIMMMWRVRTGLVERNRRVVGWHRHRRAAPTGNQKPRRRQPDHETLQVRVHGGRAARTRSSWRGWCGDSTRTDDRLALSRPRPSRRGPAGDHPQRGRGSCRAMTRRPTRSRCLPRSTANGAPP